MANEQVRAIAQNGTRLPMVNICNGREGEEWSFKEAFNSMSWKDRLVAILHD